MSNEPLSVRVLKLWGSRTFVVSVLICTCLAVLVLIPLCKLAWYEFGTTAPLLRKSVGKRVERPIQFEGVSAVSRGELLWAEYRFSIESFGFLCLHFSIASEGHVGDEPRNFATSGCLPPSQVNEIRVLE
jgi:hypothetical protein